MGKLTEKLLKTVYVKVYKTVADGRTSLCGEPVKRDAKGNEYFEIPSTFVDTAISIGYTVGEEIIKETSKPANEK